MSCSSFDLREYALDELGESERRAVEAHALSCAGCRDELERLRLTQTALLSLRDEEIPQRVAFVSDKVFEPSGWRRSWSWFWASSARLAFASSAMLLIAAFVWSRPAPVASAPASVDLARIERELDARVHAAVSKAVAESEARQEKRDAATLQAMEKRYEMDRRQLMLALDESFRVMQERRGSMILASGEPAGGPR